MRTVVILTVLFPILAFSAPRAGQGQIGETVDEAGVQVGTITLVTDDGTRVFRVLEGAMDEGFATGYTEQPVGESMVFSVRIQGREGDSGAQMIIQTGVFRDSMAQLCDPFSNNIELHPAGERSTRKRLRPAGVASTTCPDNAVDINVTDVSFEESSGILSLEGTFSGSLGRGDEAIHVSSAQFDARVRAFGDMR